MTSPAVSPSLWNTLRHRDFCLVWLGHSASSIGTYMQRVAVAWQLYELTGRPTALGILGACRLLPLLSCSLVGGVLADRVDRRWLMVASAVVMSLSSLALAVCTLTGTITPSVIYTSVLLASAAGAFYGPARQALTPSLVPADFLQRAIGLNTLAVDVAATAGPALGGLLFANDGVASVYALDAVSYGAVVLALLLVRAPAMPKPATPESPLRALTAGFRFVFGQPLIRSAMLLDFFGMFFGQATVLYPMFVKDILRVGPQSLGLLYSATAAGSVLTGVLLSILPQTRRHGLALTVAFLIYGIATIVFGLSRSLPLTLLALAVCGGADTVSRVLRSTLRQRLTPDALRGRMTAVSMLFFSSGPHLGDFESGLMAAWSGPAMAVVFGGCGVLVTVAVSVIFAPALTRFQSSSGRPA